MSTHPRFQRTIAGPARVEGFGYWSGKDATIEFRPAPVNSGVVFVRRDLPSPVRIPASVQHRIEIPRRTVLSHQRASVEMVEHVLAALAGLQVDNCEVWIDAAEVPGCDGSSQAFVEALHTAGIVEQAAPRATLYVRETTRLGDENCWVEARPCEDRPGLFVKYRLDYGSAGCIGRQTMKLQVTPESFRQELAPARTFVLEEEAEWLRSQGLGTRVTREDLLVFGAEGLQDNTLRFEDECVRHKTLDLVGDLALAGCDIVGQITAHRSGHRLNAELVRVLLAEGQIVQPRRKTA
ncbi:MAG: UDP-3-O-[3-hydroxymyristoyl] N-acetylglucosamine deacetylase [Planctomycetales bacterium]|nr:UDP-3-O-[3-hydroxymyristoyl] N-acetylglucosamine deacetylase [Planctomycetales bacterium]